MRFNFMVGVVSISILLTSCAFVAGRKDSQQGKANNTAATSTDPSPANYSPVGSSKASENAAKMIAPLTR